MTELEPTYSPQDFTDLVAVLSLEEGRLMEQAATTLPDCKARIVAQGADDERVLRGAALMYATSRAQIEGQSDMPGAMEFHRDRAEQILRGGGAIVHLVIRGTPSATEYYRNLDKIRVSALGLAG